MSRLGRVPPSAGRVVIDRKACHLSLLDQVAVWLLELRVSHTFLYNLWIICSVHGYTTRRPASTSCPRSGRFRLRELRVSRTFLDNLRLICSVHGHPARRAASTADPADPPRSWSTNYLVLSAGRTRGYARA